MPSGRKRILDVLRGSRQSSSSTVHRSGSDGCFRAGGRSIESVTMVTMFAMIYVADTIRTIHSSRFIVFFECGTRTFHARLASFLDTVSPSTI